MTNSFENVDGVKNEKRNEAAVGGIIRRHLQCLDTHSNVW